ncbi:methyl-accepting chemotaxis protein [uncultured Pseudodesulfovibrio sp.]|uniref:methyl-accepting chemotaxis protein n=1 Tax=uncultured Pseudodesulfovibrio sp. TaxID=2035858 RepID=UPI0029C6850A|nr:methyl-accepting chemotaxis protein [uncultured Pseudodesulfovibrio sp.]
MGSLSIRGKLLTLFFLALFTALAVIGVSVNSLYSLSGLAVEQSRDAMLQGQREKIKAATSTMAQTLASAIRGVDTEEAQLEIFRELIKNAFFEDDRSGYFFIYTGTTNVAHPVKPALQGKDLDNLKGADGVYSVRELAKAANSGGGFVDFTWDKPGKNHPVPKLGYATMIPGTKYWIGTGVYMDDIQERTAAIKETEATSTRHALEIQLAAAAGLCLLILLPFSMIISRNIITPITETKEAAKSIATGQFDTVLNIRTRDEIGELQQSLTAMAKSLKDSIQDLQAHEAEAKRKAEEAGKATQMAEAANERAKQKTDELLEAAEELDKAVDAVSNASGGLSSRIRQAHDGATEQASRVESAATTMNEMSATILEIAHNASDTAMSVDRAKGMADEGAAVVLRVVHGIEDVAEKSKHLMADMKNLGDQAKSIGVIINVINDIADQTNLLALNAAIEAARAGEAGRGFAVVADEVRKLAEKTMSATNDVTNAVKNIQTATQTNIDNTVESVKVIDHVTVLANDSGESLRQIVELVNDATGQVQSIATAAEEHSAASEELNLSILQISEISEKTAEIMDESKTVVLDLTQLVDTLSELTERMKA